MKNPKTTSPTDRNQLVSALALELRNAEAGRAGFPAVTSLEELDNPDHYRVLANNVLKSIGKLGICFIPNVATQAMSNAGYDAMRDVAGADFVEDGAHSVFKAMLAAGPFR